MGMKRALTTSYHPQADRQTENLNKTLEIALHAYVGPSCNNWAEFLKALALSYNTTPHTQPWPMTSKWTKMYTKVSYINLD